MWISIIPSTFNGRVKELKDSETFKSFKTFLSFPAILAGIPFKSVFTMADFISQPENNPKFAVLRR